MLSTASYNYRPDRSATVGPHLRCKPFWVHQHRDQCDVTASSGTYTITLHTPPVTARNSVSMAAAAISKPRFPALKPNSFGAFVGQPQSTVGAHAVALHQPGNTAFGFALYSGTVVTSGNSSEVISGNIYTYRNATPQSNGHASICAQGGSLVLGGPQYPTPCHRRIRRQVHHNNGTPYLLRLPPASPNCSVISGGQAGQQRLKGVPIASAASP